MVRILLVFLSIIVFCVFLGRSPSAQAQETGTLSITTTPVSGAIYVDYLFKGKKFWSGDLDVGTHAVSFGAVDGYIAPPQQVVTIIADQTYYVVGAYRKFFSLLKSAYILPNVPTESIRYPCPNHLNHDQEKGLFLQFYLPEALGRNFKKFEGNLIT